MSKHHNSKREPEVANGAVPMTSSAGAAIHDLPLPAEGNDGDVETARLAYSYWEARGGADGSAEGDWVRAEREMNTLRP
jgi:hypothetical protein